MDSTLLETIANEARALLLSARWNHPFDMMHGVEVLPGIFNIYNTITGQSKMVLLHEESGYIFKRYYLSNRGWTASGSYIGTCVFDDVEYQIRIPRFYVFGDVCAQEYINSDSHSCEFTIGGEDWKCPHAKALSNATGYSDCHLGNWKVFNGEIVLFDFD